MKRNCADIRDFKLHPAIYAIWRSLHLELSSGCREVQYSSPEIRIASAESYGIQSMTATEVKQICRMGRQSDALDHLVHHLRGMVCLAQVVNTPLFWAQGRVKFLRLSMSDVFFKIHEAQVQAAVQDCRM